MAIGVPEVRQALQKGPRSRDDLARDLHCGRADISKQLYSLIRAGEAIEEGDLVILASQARKTVESMDSTTPTEKIASRADNGAGMGVVDVGIGQTWEETPRKPEDAGADDQDLRRRGDDIRAQLDKTYPDTPLEHPHPYQSLRDAMALLMAELPALLEDREKLRKLREVLG